MFRSWGTRNSREEFWNIIRSSVFIYIIHKTILSSALRRRRSVAENKKMFELVGKKKRIQKNYMVAIAFILRKHVEENFFKSVAWCILDILYTRLLGVDVRIYGQGSGFFSHPSPIWTSSVATHLNLRRHLLAIRISRIKCLIRYDFHMRFRVFRSQKMKCFSKPSSGKKPLRIFPTIF